MDAGAFKRSLCNFPGNCKIIQVLLEAGDGFVRVEKTKKDDKDWVIAKIDTKKI